MPKEITLRPKSHNDVYIFISEYWQKNFRSPSIREIVAGTKIKSTSQAAQIARALVKEGMLIRVQSSNTSRKYVPKWVPGAIKKIEDIWK